MIKIAITDDQRSIRDNLEEIFATFDTEIQVVFTANDGEAAVHKMTTLPEKPAVILMDIEMRKMDGIEATRQIKQLFPKVRIIMLTVFERDDKIFAAIKAGADGYLLKDEPPREIVRSIQAVLEGRLVMSPLVAGKTLEFLRSRPAPSKTPADYQLTKRETEILLHLARGKSYQVVATELIISPNTVRSHIENIYQKLAVHSKVEASEIAIRNNWL